MRTGKFAVSRLNTVYGSVSGKPAGVYCATCSKPLRYFGTVARFYYAEQDPERDAEELIMHFCSEHGKRAEVIAAALADSVETL